MAKDVQREGMVRQRNNLITISVMRLVGGKCSGFFGMGGGGPEGNGDDCTGVVASVLIIL